MKNGIYEYCSYKPIEADNDFSTKLLDEQIELKVIDTNRLSPNKGELVDDKSMTISKNGTSKKSISNRSLDKLKSAHE